MASSYVTTDRYYICERLPDAIFDWRLLGSPEMWFGFSRFPSWGLEWARDACLRHMGDVRLASLDTHFDDVMRVIWDKYPTEQFWVDASLSAGEGRFEWGSRVEVEADMWLDTPGGGDDVTKVVTMAGQTGLKALNHSSQSLHFICQGLPATPVRENLQFSPPCHIVQTTMETTTIAESESTSSSNMTSDNYNTSTLSNTTPERIQTASASGETTAPATNSTEDDLTSSAGDNDTASSMTSSSTDFLYNATNSTTTSSLSFSTTRLDNDAIVSSTTTMAVPDNISTTVEPQRQQTDAATGSVFRSRNCTCALFNLTVFLKSEEASQKAIKDLEHNLLLNRSNLSSTVRRLTSAADDRPSARVMGSFGVIVLIVIALILIASDVIDAVTFLSAGFRFGQKQCGAEELSHKS